MENKRKEAYNSESTPQAMQNKPLKSAELFLISFTDVKHLSHLCDR